MDDRPRRAFADPQTRSGGGEGARRASRFLDDQELDTAGARRGRPGDDADATPTGPGNHATGVAPLIDEQPAEPEITVRPTRGIPIDQPAPIPLRRSRPRYGPQRQPDPELFHRLTGRLPDESQRPPAPRPVASPPERPTQPAPRSGGQGQGSSAGRGARRSRPGADATSRRGDRDDEESHRAGHGPLPDPSPSARAQGGSAPAGAVASTPGLPGWSWGAPPASRPAPGTAHLAPPTAPPMAPAVDPIAAASRAVPTDGSRQPPSHAVRTPELGPTAPATPHRFDRSPDLPAARRGAVTTPSSPATPLDPPGRRSLKDPSRAGVAAPTDAAPSGATPAGLAARNATAAVASPPADLAAAAVPRFSPTESAAVAALSGPRHAGEAVAAPRSARAALSWLFVHRRPRYSTSRGDIEGIRAIAVIFVILFHLAVPRVGGGFAGVDIFFVISGFLITSHLLATVRRGQRVSLVDFWARRVRRLLPAASLVLLSTLLAGWLLLPGSWWQPLAKDSGLAAVYVINWGLAARAVSYVGSDIPPTPVQHFWSLAVEEQFYLVWPVVILLCWLIARASVRRTLAWVTVTLLLVVTGSLTFSWWYTRTNPDAAYFSSLTRAWEIGLGALVALLVPALVKAPRWLAQVLAPIGLAGVLASAFVIAGPTQWPSWYALVPTGGVVLVLVAGTITERTPFARLLGTAPMRQIGMLSYSLYLWHWPVLVIWQQRVARFDWLDKVGVVALTFVLSSLTLRLVEDPIRFSTVLSRRRWLVLVAGVVMMACTISASIGLYRASPRVDQVDVLATGDAPSQAPTSASTPTPTPRPTPVGKATRPVTGDRLGALALVDDSAVTGVPTVRPDVAKALATTDKLTPQPAAAGRDQPSVYATGCERSHQTTELAPAGQCIIGDPAATTTVAVVGDSKADQWEAALDVIGKRHHWRIEILTKSGCGFGKTNDYPQCNAYNAKVLAKLLAAPPTIVLTSTFAQVEGTGAGMVDHLGRIQAKGSKIVALADNPDPNRMESLYQCAERSKALSECAFTRNPGHGTAALTELSTKLPGTTLINLNDWICPPALDKCPVAIGNVFIYRQSSHLTNTYVKSLTPMLERSLVERGLIKPPVLALQP